MLRQFGMAVVSFILNFLKSFFLAFSMFSKVPVPRVEWNERNMRYMMCFFPFVGFLIGVLGFGFCCLLQVTGFGNGFGDETGGGVGKFLWPLVFTLIPIFVTGGIHLDGFMDTSDALGSHAPKEKKLEILKDAHVGAFAVIGCVVYILSYFVVSAEFFAGISAGFSANGFGKYGCVFFIFPLSRFLSALAVAIFPCAKNSGLVHTFADSAARKFTAVWCLVWILGIYGTVIFLFGMAGCVMCAVSLAVFLWYFLMSKKQFGGITGDLAGWFVQMCELLCFLMIVV